jgi:cytochrome b
MKTRTLIWDWPVRVFHWSLAASFAGAWLTADSERWRDIHIACGYTMAGLIAFRLLWGVIGTRHARFGDFVRGPAAVWRYLRSLPTRTPEPHAGHNPAGAVAILLLLALGLATAGSGWAVQADLGGDWLEELHEILANTMLAVVVVHVAGVVASSILHRENLVAGMLTGRKPGHAGAGIRTSRPLVALLLLLSLGGYWSWTLAARPQAVPGVMDKSPAAHQDRDDDD